MLRHIPDFLNPSALNIIINLMTHSAGLLLNQLFAIVQENREPMKQKKKKRLLVFFSLLHLQTKLLLLAIVLLHSQIR